MACAISRFTISIVSSTGTALRRRVSARLLK